LGLGQIAIIRQEFDTAEDYLSAAIVKGEMSAKVVWSKMRVNYFQDEDALNLLKYAAVQENSGQAIIALEEYLVATNRLDDLVKIYTQLVKNGDTTAIKRFSMLMNLSSVKPNLVFEMSVEAGKLAVQKKDLEVFYLVGGGMFEAWQANYRRAELKAVFEGLIGFTDEEMAYCFGSTFFENKNTAEAIIYLELAIKKGSKKAGLLMAAIMRDIGDFNLAEKYLLEAMRSGDQELVDVAVRGLISLYSKFGEIEKILMVNDLIGEVGREVRSENLVALLAETQANMVMAGRIQQNSSRKVVSN